MLPRMRKNSSRGLFCGCFWWVGLCFWWVYVLVLFFIFFFLLFFFFFVFSFHFIGGHGGHCLLGLVPTPNDSPHDHSGAILSPFLKLSLRFCSRLLCHFFCPTSHMSRMRSFKLCTIPLLLNFMNFSVFCFPSVLGPQSPQYSFRSSFFRP